MPIFHGMPIPPYGARTSTSEGENIALATGPSIAVMPLLNLTGDEDQVYFTDGLTEELTAELARYQEFQVIATQSTLRFKGRKADPRKIGRDLDVRFLLAGSIQKDLKTVKIAVRLIDASNAAQIWGENYKRDLNAADLIELQEKIARRIVGVIADQFGLISRKLSRESRKKSPANLKAYDAILRFYHYETELTPAAFEKALTFAQKGVALAPDNQFARDALTLVYFHRGDKDFFLQNVEETIALNPNSPYIVGVAGWHITLYGEWDRGLDLLKKGMKLNPYHPSWFHLAPYMDYCLRGEYENALAEALKFNYPELFWDPLVRAAALGRLERHDEAQTAVSQLLKLEPDFATRGRLLISRYLKVDDLIDTIIEDLRKAGLADLE